MVGGEYPKSPVFQFALAKLLVEYPKGYIILIGHLDRQTNQALAKREGISRNAVRSRLEKAKTLMRRFIEEAINGE